MTAGCGANSSQPQSDHLIILRNESDTTRQISVTVSQSEVVYENDFTLRPGERENAYNIEQADPTGVEEFDITVVSGDGSETIRLVTTDCYGDLLAEIQSEGGLDLRYTSIC